MLRKQGKQSKKIMHFFSVYLLKNTLAITIYIVTEKQLAAHTEPRFNWMSLWRIRKMTRKDFVLIANALVEAAVTIDTVKIIAKELAKTNPRFDNDRFVLAAMNWE